jgi:hypothetical protein
VAAKNHFISIFGKKDYWRSINEEIEPLVIKTCKNITKMKCFGKVQNKKNIYKIQKKTFFQKSLFLPKIID